MTRVEALRSALRAAVRDGDREVARALTRAVIDELPTRKPLTLVRNQPQSPKGTRGLMDT